MLTVEQVRNLDNKVKSALELIEKLRSENSMLKSKLGEYESRVEQLENVVDGFKLEQLEIEEGIKDVLSQLDQLEDQLTAPDTDKGASSVETLSSEPSAVELTAQAVETAAETTAAPRVTEPSSEPAAEYSEKPDHQVSSTAPELEIF